jgi:hypothetical protein
MSRAGLMGLLLACGALSCTKYQVNYFVPDKTDLCPGEAATLAWDVNGPAHLKIVSGSSHLDQNVLSKGTLEFSEAAFTSFTLTAIKQNPAEGNFKPLPIDVVSSGPRGQTGPCNAGVCSATFTPKAGLARVARLSAPLVKVAGHDVATPICVTHANLPQPTCIAPGQTLTVDVPFDGAWILAATMPPPATPPTLAINFDFNCPAL